VPAKLGAGKILPVKKYLSSIHFNIKILVLDPSSFCDMLCKKYNNNNNNNNTQ
jgi:hypothetical protein